MTGKSQHQRMVEREKVHTALSLLGHGKIIFNLSIVYSIGFVALMVLLGIAGSQMKEVAEDTELFESGNNPSVGAYGSSEALLMFTTGLYSQAQKILVQEEQGVCHMFTANSGAASNEVADSYGNDKYTGCPGRIESSWSACRKLCESEGLSACQRNVLQQRNDSNTACKFWVFKKQASWLGKKYSFQVYTQVTPIIQTQCYTFPSYEEFFRAAPTTTKKELRDVRGFSSCFTSTYKFKFLTFVRNLQNVHIRRVEFNTASLQAFVEASCLQEHVWYDGRLTESNFFETRPAYLNEFCGNQQKLDHCFCKDYCTVKYPLCKTLLHYHDSDSDSCYVTDAVDVHPSGRDHTYESCHSKCVGDDGCVAFTLTTIPYVHGDYLVTCRMYGDTKKLTAKSTPVKFWKLRGRRIGSSRYNVIKSGVRGCEKSDYQKRNHITYKTTSRVHVPCGTSLDKTSIVGTAFKTVSGVANGWKGCSSKCTADGSCNFWAYERGSKKCHLYEHVDNIDVKDDGFTSGSRHCNGFCAHDVLYEEEGAGNKHDASTAKECREKCETDETCVKWSWSHTASTCFFHSTKGIRKSESGASSGPWYCTLWPSIMKCPMEGTVIVGNWIQEVWSKAGMTWQKCAARCQQDTYCNFWQFFKYNNKNWPMQQCNLYADDSFLVSKPTLPSNRIYKIGYRDCQEETENVSGIEHSATMSFLPTAGPSWYFPFKYSTRGWKISGLSGEAFAQVDSVETCEESCFNPESRVGGVDNVGWLVYKSPYYPDSMRRCQCLTQTEWDSVNGTKKRLSESDLSDPRLDYVLGHRDCPRTTFLAAQKHYMEYSATFVGYGCFREDCILGSDVGDHVILSVATVQICVARCYEFGKSVPVARVTYSSGYKACYCHLKQYATSANFYPREHMHQEYVNYVYS